MSPKFSHRLGRWCYFGVTFYFEIISHVEKGCKNIRTNFCVFITQILQLLIFTTLAFHNPVWNDHLLILQVLASLLSVEHRSLKVKGLWMLIKEGLGVESSVIGGDDERWIIIRRNSSRAGALFLACTALQQAFQKQGTRNTVSSYLLRMPYFLKKLECPFSHINWWQLLKNPPANVRDADSILESGRSLGEGNGNPLQYSCLENPVDRKPGGLRSMGSQRVRHDWEDLACISI